MSGFNQWLQQLQPEKLIEMLLIAAASLLCITVHETCHGLAAYWMGDDTAKRMGRLSLNPIKHIDIVGLIMMVVARFGWAKPVPVNMQRFKHPKLGMAITAVAGPLSNVILMLICAILRILVIFYLDANEYLMLFLEYTLVLSAGLAVFNLFPIPPLDGSKVLFSFLPKGIYRGLMRYERYGMLILAVLLFMNVLDGPLMYLRGGLIEFSNIAVKPLVEYLLEHI